jgi:hypothetical protein
MCCVTGVCFYVGLFIGSSILCVGNVCGVRGVGFYRGLFVGCWEFDW